MKVAVYAQNSVFKKMQTALDIEGFETIVIPHGLENAMAMEEKVTMSLAIVDTAAAEAGDVYEHLKKSCDIPVILITNSNDNNWGTLGELDADGYICRNAGNSEIVARVTAVQRRINKSLAVNTVKGS
jgi:DNA-binding response OmpR family regulator